MEELADRAAAHADVVVNAAGVAHIERPTPDDLERLQIGNVELPVALARAAIEHGVPLIHISSVKAADAAPKSPYARSKHEADERLFREFAPSFENVGTSLEVIRPLALLFPPLDAGKVTSLRFLRRLPAALTPPLRLPVLAPPTFLDAVERAVDRATSGATPPGWSLREFSRSECGSLRDVRAAMLAWTEEGVSR
jgi:nucleoside-diphosphate-sugar epimerase